MKNRNTPLAKFAYLLDKMDAIIKAVIYEELYNLDGLFNEFSGLQKQKDTFKNTQLEELFNFLETKFEQRKYMLNKI